MIDHRLSPGATVWVRPDDVPEPEEAGDLSPDALGGVEPAASPGLPKPAGVVEGA